MTDNMKNSTIELGDLDEFFAAARTQEKVPSSDLMARVLADAATTQAGFAAQRQTKTAPARGGVLESIAGFFGGWAAVSALTACVCVGVLTGLSAPDVVMGYVPGIEVQSDDVGLGLFGSFAEADLATEG